MHAAFQQCLSYFKVVIRFARQTEEHLAFDNMRKRFLTIVYVDVSSAVFKTTARWQSTQTHIYGTIGRTASKNPSYGEDTQYAYYTRVMTDTRTAGCEQCGEIR